MSIVIIIIHHYKNEQDQDNDDMSLAEVKWNRRTSHLNSKIVKI